MTKMNVWSSGAGIITAIFMLAATAGAVLQFIFLYLPLFRFTGGAGLVIMFFIFSIAAMALGALALILSIFGIPKVLWAIFAFLIIGFSLVLPIWMAIDAGVFPYVIGAAIKVNDTWVEYIINNAPLHDYLAAIREYNKALDKWREEKDEVQRT